jgi:hypothetical protein
MPEVKVRRPAVKRNQFLTPAMRRFLIALRDGEDKYAVAEGREVWVDNRRFSRVTLNRLLRLCLIKAESISGHEPEIYYHNEEGDRIIDDPRYEPLICAALRSREASRG